jgi:3-oxoacyl-(acyl-carrier-protein) synthase
MAGKPERRVVVTGMGVVSPVGHDVDTFYNNLLEVSQSCRGFDHTIYGETWALLRSPAVGLSLSAKDDILVVIQVIREKLKVRKVLGFCTHSLQEDKLDWELGGLWSDPWIFLCRAKAV